MGAFGSISLANKFGIVLGCLVLVAFGAGLVKLWINKRRLRKHVKLADVESTKKSQRQQRHARRDDDPRYLFGVRAIERGYFGGVAQTRSISSLGSLTDSNHVNGSSHGRINDANLSLPHPVLSLGNEEKQIRRKPTPLRLHPVELYMDEKGSQRDIHPGSTYEVSPTSPTENASFDNTALPYPQQTQVGGKRSSTKTHPKVPPSERPTSFLPRFNFPEPLRENLEPNLFIPTPSNSIRSKKSKRGIAMARTSLPKVTEQPLNSEKASPSYSAFPPLPIPAKSKLRSQRTIFPQEDRERVHSRRPSNFILSIPSKPAATITTSSQDDATTAAQSTASRKSSDAISLAALTGTPIKSTFPLPPPSPPDSESEESRGRGSLANIRQQSRKPSSKSLSRTRDSIHRPRSTSASKRRSIQRDVLHYDPRSHYRDRGGSIQGRPIDFSQPRESPFSDLAAIASKGHTPSGSAGSENSIISYYTTTKSERHGGNSYRVDAITENLNSTRNTDSADIMTKDGSRLRFTLDNFGTKNLSISEEKIPRTSIVNQKIAAQLYGQEDKAPNSGSFSVAHVESRKPRRISSHGEEWDLLKSRMVSLETQSTSTSPVVGSPGLVGERFPKIARY